MKMSGSGACPALVTSLIWRGVAWLLPTGMQARRAASKQAKPLWEEDGRRRGLLDKYDEEEEEGGLSLGDIQVGHGGSLESDLWGLVGSRGGSRRLTAARQPCCPCAARARSPAPAQLSATLSAFLGAMPLHAGAPGGGSRQAGSSHGRRRRRRGQAAGGHGGR